MLQIRHEACTRGDVVVLEGLAHEHAVRHLCRTLCNGAAFDDTGALVVDMGNVSRLSPSTVAALHGAAQSWERGHRWFALAGSRPLVADDQVVRDHSYSDVSEALRGARRFDRLVGDRRGWTVRPLIVFDGVRGCLAALTGAAGDVVHTVHGIARLAGGQIVR